MRSFFIVYLTIICVVSAQKFLYLSLGDVCKGGPSVWRCKRITDCPSLKELREKGERPDVCSFQGPEVIICCPSSTQPVIETTTTPRPTTTNLIIEEERSVWGSWTRKPSGNIKTTTNKPIQITKSKAEQKCEEYSKLVVVVLTSPVLSSNRNPSKIEQKVCAMEPLIVGGENARPKEFPHMALIGSGERPKIEWFCGGSLISPNFILTAAHCTQPGNRVAGWVRLGDLDTSMDYDDAQPIELRIKRSINHPLYNEKVLYHDIALCELEREVKFNSYIRPLCLHTSKDVDSNVAIASGWGHTSWQGRASSMLQKVNLTMLSLKKCNDQYGRGEYNQKLPNGIVDDLMVCAGGELGKDTCQGDSGGPLQIIHKNADCMYSQIGVVSFGRACALSFPGVYTRVSNYIKWIENIVWP